LADARGAELFREQLAETRVRVTVNEELRYVIAAARASVDTIEGTSQPALLEAKGMSMEHVRAFADAAAMFYDAAPWERIRNDELIRIDQPRVDDDMSFCSVLGSGGDEFGLGFYRVESQFDVAGSGSNPERLFELADRGLWSMTFDELDMASSGDLAAWRDHDLPLAADNAYPLIVRYGRTPGRVGRPSPRVLAFVEGLMHAFVETTDEQLDRGQWSIDVPTAEGAMTFHLNLNPVADSRDATDQPPFDPRMRDRMMRYAEKLADENPQLTPEQLQELLNREMVGRHVDELDMHPETPLEHAQELCYQALGARGRQRVKLARAALDVCDDCADAHIILAEETDHLSEAKFHYMEAINAVRRAVSDDVFEEAVGECFDVVDTRPYLRALGGLASVAMEMDEPQQAIDHLREMLRLDREDRSGARVMLLNLLFGQDRIDEAETLIDAYSGNEDVDPLWAYSRALVTFLHDGDSADARRQLDGALRDHPMVPDLLFDDDVEAEDSLEGQMAEICVATLEDIWMRTSGAMEWLERRAETIARKSRKR
jgi:AhpD family alkylhydroperoxidase